MKPPKKTLVGGLIAIILSFGCCWISALAVWLGSTTLLGVLALYMESIQIPLLVIGIALITVAIVSLFKKNSKKQKL